MRGHQSRGRPGRWGRLQCGGPGAPGAGAERDLPASQPTSGCPEASGHRHPVTQCACPHTAPARQRGHTVKGWPPTAGICGGTAEPCAALCTGRLITAAWAAPQACAGAPAGCHAEAIRRHAPSVSPTRPRLTLHDKACARAAQRLCAYTAPHLPHAFVRCFGRSPPLLIAYALTYSPDHSPRGLLHRAQCSRHRDVSWGPPTPKRSAHQPEGPPASQHTPAESRSHCAMRGAWEASQASRRG